MISVTKYLGSMMREEEEEEEEGRVSVCHIVVCSSTCSVVLFSYILLTASIHSSQE